MTDKLTTREIEGIFNRIKDYAYPGKSVDEIAKALGLHRSSVYQWKGGKNPPSLKTLILIQGDTGVSIDWILTGRGPVHVRDVGETEITISRIVHKIERLPNEQHRQHIRSAIEMMEAYIDSNLSEDGKRKKA